MKKFLCLLFFCSVAFAKPINVAMMFHQHGLYENHKINAVVDASANYFINVSCIFLNEWDDISKSIKFDIVFVLFDTRDDVYREWLKNVKDITVVDKFDKKIIDDAFESFQNDL